MIEIPVPHGRSHVVVSTDGKKVYLHARNASAALSFDESEHLAAVLRDVARIIRAQHGVGLAEVA